MGERKRPLEPLTPGIKITLQMPTDFNDEDLKFAKQIGVCVCEHRNTGGKYETFADIKRRVEAAGLKLANVGNTSVHNMPEVTLNLPGRDQKIEEYKQYLRDLSPGRNLLHDVRPHGQRHLDHPSGKRTRGGAPAPRLPSGRCEGLLG